MQPPDVAGFLGKVIKNHLSTTGITLVFKDVTATHCEPNWVPETSEGKLNLLTKNEWHKNTALDQLLARL